MRKMINKIMEIAVYKRLTEGGVKCWWVKQDVLTNLEITPDTTNEWSYILEQRNNKNSTTDDLNTSRPGCPCIRVSDHVFQMSSSFL